MSKIGNKAISIPEGVEVKIDKGVLEAKGSKGSLSLNLHKEIEVEIQEKEMVIRKHKNFESSKKAGAIWGLTRSLISNMVTGVSKGYEKKLELQGVGFRMNMAGNKLVMALGFSHPVEVVAPEGITVKVEENNVLSISGIDKQKVGQFAAEIRSLKPVEPYKGKGFRYQGERVRRKAGKKAGAK